MYDGVYHSYMNLSLATANNNIPKHKKYYVFKIKIRGEENNISFD